MSSITRRDFVRRGTVTALGAAALRHTAGSASGQVQSPSAPPFDLEEATLADLQRRMTRGEDTSVSLVRKYLARIEGLDRAGPALRQLLDINPDAEAVAAALDEERRQRGPRGPLHGVPVLIKDNIDTADRMTTTAGSLALEGTTRAADAFVAARLRAAGAVLLAKTNMSEWANFRSMRASSGWSARGGQARNPYALDRTPSGSSSGSGGAIAANYAAVAIGTETDGSIVSPAAHTSLVGIKPTVGLVSRSGIIPIAHSQDTAGPMTRTVADAAALLTAIAGSDPADPITRDAVRHAADYATFLDAQGLKGARLGVMRKDGFGYSPHADRIVSEALDEMKRQGAVIVDPVDLPTSDQFGDNEVEVLLYEFKADLNAYLGRLEGARVRTLRDVIEFNEQHEDRELAYFGQELMIRADSKGPLTSAPYREALTANHNAARRDGIDAAMKRHKLDAIVAPTTAPPSPIDLVNGDAYLGGSSSVPAVAGYPHITVPAGFAFGLPVGISFFGRAFTEPTLIRLAYAFEQATRHRQPPRFLPKAV
jgi:amidase